MVEARVVMLKNRVVRVGNKVVSSGKKREMKERKENNKKGGNNGICYYWNWSTIHSSPLTLAIHPLVGVMSTDDGIAMGHLLIACQISIVIVSVAAPLHMFVVHVNNESYLAENLERLGSLQSENDTDISAAFFKFAVVTKELSALMKNLVRR